MPVISGTKLLLLLTKRLTWHFVKKLQGHVTHTKKTTTCSADKERNEGQRHQY